MVNRRMAALVIAVCASVVMGLQGPTAVAEGSEYTVDALARSGTPWEDFASWPRERQLLLIDELQRNGSPSALDGIADDPLARTLAATNYYTDLAFGALEIASCIVTVDLASCNIARADATTAQNAAIAQFPNTLLDGAGDALRHCYWNGLMYNHIGDRGAAMIAGNHEAASSSTTIRFTMDTRNNALGRSYATTRNDGQVKSWCTSQAYAGRGLWKIWKRADGSQYLGH